MIKNVLTLLAIVGFVTGLLFVSQKAYAVEVEKGMIPAEHVDVSCKKLPFEVAVWDAEEAVAQLKKDEKHLWIDTRPASFYDKGSVRDAILLPYNKTGADGNELTPESLEEALKTAGMTKDTAKVVFFCQGPKCHRSYNASYVAVKDWGYDPENIIWFRAGYPFLLKAIKNDPKLKRRAKKYISDSGIKQL